MATTIPPAGGAARSYTCPYCGFASDGTAAACPGCAAPVDVRRIAAPDRWLELPGQKDMAKLQFGNSSCQIEGTYVPVADVKLAAGEGVYFAHHVLLWMEPQINISAMPLKGGFKRMLAGMPIVMTGAKGPGHVAFSRDEPGELLALPLGKGQTVDVREHLFVLAPDHVSYDWFSTAIWYKVRFQDGNDTKTETIYPMGMFMDRFSAAERPGFVLLHSGGNVFVRTLQKGQTILVKPTALLFKDSSVAMQIHFEHPSASYTYVSGWNQRYIWLRLFGPGRVAIMSAFSHVEHESAQIVGCSPSSERRW